MEETVKAYACGTSGDSGIDADKGVYLNGGTIIASGNMLDRMQGEQGYLVFNFQTQRKGNVSEYIIKNASGENVISDRPENDFSKLVISSDKLKDGEYNLWCDEKQLDVAKMEGVGGMHGGMPPMGERPEGEFKPHEGMPPKGEMPEGMTPPDFPKDGKIPHGERPDGEKNPQSQRFNLEYSKTFKIEKGANTFIVAVLTK